jgi:hypothetical protein
MSTTLQKTAPERTSTEQRTPQKDRRKLWMGLVGLAAGLTVAGIAVGVFSLVAQSPTTADAPAIFSPEEIRARNFSESRGMDTFSPEAVRARNLRGTSQQEILSPERYRVGPPVTTNPATGQQETFSPEAVRARNHSGTASGGSDTDEIFSPEAVRARNHSGTASE